MTSEDRAEILAAIARLDTKIEGLASTDEGAEKRLNAHSSRLDKLERIAYVALGVGIASGAPQVVQAIGGGG